MKAGSGATRYSTELGVLSHFLGGRNIADPADVLDKTFWGDTSKFKGGWEALKKELNSITTKGIPQINVSLFNAFRLRGAELSKVMVKGDSPSKFSWVGGQNKSADSDPSDVLFTSGSEFSGVSIKASASATLTNLTAREVDKSIEDNGASVDDENSEEIIDALEDNLPKEFSKENSDIFIKTAASEFKALWHKIVMEYLREIKDENTIYGFSKGEGEKKDTLKKEKISEGQKKSEKIKYGILRKGDEYFVVVDFNIESNPTKKEDFYSYNLKSKHFRPFGNYFVQNAPIFRKERDAFFNKIKDGLQKQFEKLLETKENIFKFLSISPKSYYYLTDKKIILVKKQADFGDNISVNVCPNISEDNTGIQYNVEILDDGIAKASFTLYLRYANGVFVGSPTIRIQSPKGFTNFCWEVLSGNEKTNMASCKESSINEGGNVSVKLGSEVHTADKLDMNKISREKITTAMARMFNDLNDKYEAKYKFPLWKNREYLNSNMVFNGSSNAFFDKSIDDTEFKKYKPIVGDLDISVPNVHAEQLFEFLKGLEGKEVSPGVVYLGMNKTEAGKNAQFNCLFFFKEFNVKVQVDFELVEYGQDGKQTAWSAFSHSSVWQDTVMGAEAKLKGGVAHKFLIINMVRALSVRNDILVLTKGSPIPKDESENGKMKVSKMSEGRLSMLAFSVDRGMRIKYEQLFYEDGSPIILNGKFVFKEIPAVGSNYLKNLDEIFEMIFKHKPENGEVEQFKSFYGALQLMKKYGVDQKIIKNMVDIMITESLWGRGAQPLSLSGPEEDFEIKVAIINEIEKFFPFIKGSLKKHEDLINTYNSTTKFNRRE